MIYCVEDDAAVRELAVYALNAAGFAATGFADAASFWAAMNSAAPEMILLDIMLPDDDGMQILKKLRADALTARIPVIMATAKGTEFDKVSGLDAGADDYLAKPFGMVEMIARVRAVLRRAAPPATSAVLRHDGVELDEESRSVRANGHPVELTRKEYELLRVLLRHPGRVFDRQSLLDLVWDAGFMGETRTVDMHIASLRTKLGDCGGCIRTVRGVGYRLGSKDD